MIFKYINTKNKGPTKTFSSKKVQCEQPYISDAEISIRVLHLGKTEKASGQGV